MADTSKLSDMLDAIVSNKPEEAQIAFHDYLGGRMKEELHGAEEVEAPETTDDED